MHVIFRDMTKIIHGTCLENSFRVIEMDNIKRNNYTVIVKKG